MNEDFNGKEPQDKKGLTDHFHLRAWEQQSTTYHFTKTKIFQDRLPKFGNFPENSFSI